jgi:hypothetical protein
VTGNELGERIAKHQLNMVCRRLKSVSPEYRALLVAKAAMN